jgi:hypothetical protein
MSKQVFIDCGVQNSQMIIGQNNSSTIILGNSNCITSINGLINASNASFNNLSVTSLYISGETYGGASSNMTLTNVSVSGQLYLYVGNTSITKSIITAPNVSHNNVYVASNFSMPSGSLMNVSNAVFNNISTNNVYVASNFSMPSGSLMNVSNASFNNISTNTFYVASNFSMPSGSLMNVSNASFNNISTNTFYAASNFSMPTGSLMNVSNASFNNISTNTFYASGNISTNAGGFKVVTNTIGTTPQTLLLGNSNDVNNSRIISALNSSLSTSNAVYFTMGHSNTLGNQVEMTYNHLGDNAANWASFGFFGIQNIIAFSNKKYTMIGVSSNLTTSTVMTSGLSSNPNSGTIITGNVSRIDALGIISYGDTNTLINFYPANGTSAVKGSVSSTNATSVTFTTTSDRRRKRNIIPMKTMIEKIKKLNPSEFIWREDGVKEDGFIAQEVHKIFPCMIGSVTTYCDVCNLTRNEIYDGSLCTCCDWENPTSKNGDPYYYSLDYGRFTPYLTKALQETIELVETQQTYIDELKTKQEIYMNQLKLQEDKISSLESSISSIIEKLN